MKIEPFVRVDDIQFSLTREQALIERGEPRSMNRNAVELNELDYGELVLRFQDNGRLEEITLRAEVVELGSVAVPFHALQLFVNEHDDACFERADFLVSPRFGLAFDPRDESCWVTALAEHCLPSWQAL